MNNVKENLPKVSNIGLKHYLKSIGKEQMYKVVGQIILECGISVNQFQNKMSGITKWNKLERERVAQIIGQPEEVLFPTINN